MGGASDSMGMASPSTFMRLQNPDMDPDGWYQQEPGALSVNDIFADPAI